MINLYLVNDTYDSLTITTSKYGECNMREQELHTPLENPTLSPVPVFDGVRVAHIFLTR